MHERESTRLREGGLVCHHCNATFTEKTNCMRHMKYRCQQKPVSSSNIDIASSNIDNTSSNIVIHSANVDISSSNVDSDAEKRFACEKCGKSYTRNENLHSHIPKCTGVANTLQCPKCLKIMASYSTKSRHLKTCRGQKPEKTSSSPMVVNNTTNNTTNHNTNIVTIICQAPCGVLPFGKENTSYLTTEYIRTACLTAGKRGVGDLVKAIYINPEHPENRNVWFGTAPHDTKRRCYVVGENGEVERACTDSVTEYMLSSAKVIIQNFIVNRTGELPTSGLSIDIQNYEKNDLNIAQGYLSHFSGNDRNSRLYRENKQMIKDALWDATNGIYEPAPRLISSQTSERQTQLVGHQNVLAGTQ